MKTITIHLVIFFLCVSTLSFGQFDITDIKIINESFNNSQNSVELPLHNVQYQLVYDSIIQRKSALIFDSNLKHKEGSIHIRKGYSTSANVIQFKGYLYCFNEDSEIFFIGEVYNSENFEESALVSSIFAQHVFYLSQFHIKSIHYWLDPNTLEAFQFGELKQGNGMVIAPYMQDEAQYLSVSTNVNGLTEGLVKNYYIDGEALELESISNYSGNEMLGMHIRLLSDETLDLSNLFVGDKKLGYELRVKLSKEGKIVSCTITNAPRDVFWLNNVKSQLIGKTIDLNDYYQISKDIEQLIKNSWGTLD